MHIVFPWWHRKPYGIEAAAVRTVYGWAHLIALKDAILDKAQEWQPTGAVHTKDTNYIMFRVGVLLFNLVPAIVWVGVALYYIVTWSLGDFLPIFILGIYYLFIVLKIVVYKDPFVAPENNGGCSSWR